MKIVKRVFGYIAIVLVFALFVKVLIDENFNIEVSSIVGMIEVFFTKVLNLTSGNGLQIFTKLSIILFNLAMIGLPLATLIVYILRRRHNQGISVSFFVTKFLLAWLGMVVCICSFRHIDEAVVCVLMLGFMYFSIAYFAITLFIFIKSKAIIDVTALMNETKEENLVGEEYSSGGIDIEHDETEINPADMDNQDDFFIPGVSKTFNEKFFMADEELRKAYSQLKNELLRYEKMKSRVSKSYESFHLGQYQIAKIALRGKKIKLFLALDPEAIDVSTYHQVDYSQSKKYEMTPCCLNVKSKLSIKKAIELIKFTCGQIRAHRQDNYQEVDYSIIKDEKKQEIPQSLQENAVE